MQSAALAQRQTGTLSKEAAAAGPVTACQLLQLASAWGALCGLMHSPASYSHYKTPECLPPSAFHLWGVLLKSLPPAPAPQLLFNCSEGAAGMCQSL